MDTQQNTPPVQNNPVMPNSTAAQPIVQQGNTPVIPLDPKSVLLPPKAPNVSNTPPPNYKPKRSIFKKILKFLFTIIVLAAIGAGAYFMYPKYGPMLLNLLNKNKQQNIAVEEPKYIAIPQAKSIFGNINNSSSIIAYTAIESSQSVNIGKVEFFDSNKKTKLAEDKVLAQDKNEMYSIGPWSPNGTYLPIIGLNLSTSQIINVYLFNSHNLKITKLLSLNKNDARNSWLSKGLESGTWWMDESNYVVMSSQLTGTPTTTKISYLTTDGKLLSKNIPTNLKKYNNQLNVKYEGTSTKKIQAITAGGLDLTFVPEGNPVGIVDNMLVTLILPENVALLNTTTPSDTTATEKNTLEMQSNDPTTLNFISLESGNIEKTIDLTSDTWRTHSVLPHTSEKFLVVHQTNTLLKPTKERYLLVTPSDTDPIKVIFEQDLVQNLVPTSESNFNESNFDTLEAFQGSSFFISNNGEWLVTFDGSIKSPETSKINLKNISTGEIVPVCETACFSMRTHYPYAFTTTQ